MGFDGEASYFILMGKECELGEGQTSTKLNNKRSAMQRESKHQSCMRLMVSLLKLIYGTISKTNKRLTTSKLLMGGEVLSKIEVVSGKEKILNQVIKKLDDLQLSDTNSDIKGDAFEFFLRNYGGAETDFGEYFTPRHIVKVLVKLLNPQYGETVYDPFCGTGGMLIESFDETKLLTKLVFYFLKEKQNKIYGLQSGTAQPHVYSKNDEVERDGFEVFRAKK